MAMKYYDQLEVIPIYQTAIMLMWIGAGMIILSEHRFYSQTKLVLIGLSTMLCLVGIKLLTSKKKKLHLKKISSEGENVMKNGPQPMTYSKIIEEEFYGAKRKNSSSTTSSLV